MNLFNVYQLSGITPVRGLGSRLWDQDGTEYLDLYGGHAVISVGHSHPRYVAGLEEQIRNLGFYSNSVINPLQEQLAHKLGELSGYADYQLFLCNSGAEANENALKLASFQNGRRKIIAFHKAFHGRTSLAVAVTDDKKIQAQVNGCHEVVFLDLNDEEALHHQLDETVCAVIIEGIQGLAGIHLPEDSFFRAIRKKCNETGALLIVDEVQSGYGRTGRFFAHQYAGIRPDMITVAKGMGNGFPVGGVLISPDIRPKPGMLGTTFGGNHLACTAAIAVLDIIAEEHLVQAAAAQGKKWMNSLATIPGVREVRGKGLMIGVELEIDAGELRSRLLREHQVLAGNASDKNVLRLLPALNVKQDEADSFTQSLRSELMIKTVEEKV